MHKSLVRLVQPQDNWHIIELTPETLGEEIPRQTADLLICHYLSAHCPAMQALLADWLQALKPGGWLAVLDTVVPGSGLRGKKANLQRRAGDYVNGWLRLCDGKNGRNLSQNEWLNVLRVVSVQGVQYETRPQEIEFNAWVSTINSTTQTRTRLKAMLTQAPEPVAAFLTPHTANDRITFFLTELTIVGRLENL